MFIEAGSRQPRSLANAYRTAIEAQTGTATTAMSGYLQKLDAAYGSREVRRVMSVEDCEMPASQRLSLDDLASWAADSVRNGLAE